MSHAKEIIPVGWPGAATCAAVLKSVNVIPAYSSVLQQIEVVNVCGDA